MWQSTMENTRKKEKLICVIMITEDKNGILKSEITFSNPEHRDTPDILPLLRKSLKPIKPTGFAQ